MTPAALVASLLAVAQPTPEAAEGTSSWTFEHAKVGAYAGAFSGKGVRTDAGGAALLEGAATPILKAGPWKLEVPLRFHHFQTFGASLPETYGSASASLENRIAKGFRLGAIVGLAGAWRPGWPDLYQPAPVPNPSGTYDLAPTDRYGYLSWRAGVSAGVTPLPRNQARLRYTYVHYSYVRDPSFVPDLPMHLTPRDNGQHRVEASWRRFGDGWTATGKFEWARRLDEVYLARNAITGTTSLYTTPYQRLDRMEPSVEVSLKRLGDRLDVSLLYGYQIQNDLYQGYYSYGGHHPRLVAEYDVTDRISTRVKAEAWLREYGPNSKAAGLPPDPTVPGLLENGTRLYDRKGAVSASASYELTKTLRARISGEWVRRSTNYPDYVPNVYPATKQYSIEWSYVNWLALAGVELRL